MAFCKPPSMTCVVADGLEHVPHRPSNARQQRRFPTMMFPTRMHIVTLGVFLLSACSGSAQQARAQTATDVIATVGPTPITLAQVDEQALKMPASSFGNMKLSEALYEARRAALDVMVGDALLDQQAKTQGMDRAALTAKEITAKVGAVTDADVAAWYQANQARVQGAPIDQVRAPIQALLTQQRTQSRRDEYLSTLRKNTAVKLMLDPPRQVVAENGRPARGPANAPIEMIEFSDFQCPYCLKANPTVNQVLSTYGDRIRFVYRHYPLPNHPNARPAAEAAQCANEQGKFWPYHDQLFARGGRLSDTELKTAAGEAGLDAAAFDRCVATHKYKADVDADIAAGDEAGVSGTPAFYINGRMLTGAQPFEAFKQIIDEELTRKGSR
jgi:protein-disulfide isomerase